VLPAVALVSLEDEAVVPALSLFDALGDEIALSLLEALGELLLDEPNVSVEPAPEEPPVLP
jgi:hypothetical protein